MGSVEPLLLSPGIECPGGGHFVCDGGCGGSIEVVDLVNCNLFEQNGHLLALTSTECKNRIRSSL